MQISQAKYPGKSRSNRSEILILSSSVYANFLIGFVSMERSRVLHKEVQTTSSRGRTFDINNINSMERSERFVRGRKSMKNDVLASLELSHSNWAWLLRKGMVSFRNLQGCRDHVSIVSQSCEQFPTGFQLGRGRFMSHIIECKRMQRVLCLVFPKAGADLPRTRWLRRQHLSLSPRSWCGLDTTTIKQILSSQRLWQFELKSEYMHTESL